MKHCRSPRTSHVRALALAACYASFGCAQEPGYQPEAPIPGIAFSFPANHQWDVPIGAGLILAMSHPVDMALLESNCIQDPAGDLIGSLCLVGPDGPVAMAGSVAGERNTVIRIDSILQPGTTYLLYARPELIGGSGTQATNLSAERPLLTFHTRSARPRAGQPPTLVTVNGQDPDAYRETGGALAELPTLDFSTIRVLFSEPIDPATATLGDSVVFESESGEAVAGTLLVQGPHLTFDPDEDLTPGQRYTLRLADRVLDQGGERLAETELWFAPESARLADGTLIEQVLDVDPAIDDPGFPLDAQMAGTTANVIELFSPLIGYHTPLLKDGRVRAVMGDPTAFGGAIPIAIRKGQRIAATGMDVNLGGAIATGLSTGDIEVSFVSDALGFITRNPYQDPEIPPDDLVAPLFVRLTFDVAVTARDSLGNAVLNQTVMNVQATGAASIANGALAIETVATLELDLLGIAAAPANLVMRLRTRADDDMIPDTAGPILRSAYPVPDSATAAVTDPIVLTFDEPVDSAELARSGLLVRVEPGGDDVEVDARVDSVGSALVIAPTRPLAYGREYRVTLAGTMRDLAGNAWLPEASDPSGGAGAINFRTPVLSPDIPAPPVLTALYPGVPCALVDGGPDSPGRCAGGQPGDSHYRPFTLPTDRAIEGYFNQPMRAASMQLGPYCGIGAMRVEELDENGVCVDAVPGTLTVAERRFRFVPSEPWRAGQHYRLILIAGADSACSLVEICGANDLPLNTDPLSGHSAAGGPDLTIPFTAVAPTDETYLPALIAAPGDVNGNGHMDSGEVPSPSNRASAEITSSGGIVERASLSGADCDPDQPGVQNCIYVAGTLPVDIDRVNTDCEPEDPDNPAPLQLCVPSIPYASVMIGTSVSMDAVATIAPMGSPPFTITMNDLPTGPLIMRMRDRPDGPTVGIIDEGPDGARFQVSLDMYMDAPDLPLASFNLEHDLRSKPVTIEVAGPVSFLADGRLRIDAENVGDIDLQINLASTTIPGNEGFVTMTIPAGALRLTLTSGSRHAGRYAQ